mgnify:FL=1
MIKPRVFMLITPDYKTIVKYISAKQLSELLGVKIKNLDMKLVNVTKVNGYIIAEK